MLKFNDQNEVIREEEYKAILVGVQLGEDISYSMEELKGLCEAASVESIGMMIQNMERPNSATLVGSGKVEEIRELVQNMDADLVVFNDELSGMQLRNLEDAIGVRVIDKFVDSSSTREFACIFDNILQAVKAVFRHGEFRSPSVDGFIAVHGRSERGFGNAFKVVGKIGRNLR